MALPHTLIERQRSLLYNIKQPSSLHAVVVVANIIEVCLFLGHKAVRLMRCANISDEKETSAGGCQTLMIYFMLKRQKMCQ